MKPARKEEVQEGLFQNSKGPLAHRIRPKELRDFVGQTHILNPSTIFYNSILKDSLGSIILYGPPGTGKTTLAGIIAKHTSKEFETLNATDASVCDIKELGKRANSLNKFGKGLLVFIDEIHRFSRSQQEALLGYIEKGTFTLIGATTQNPFFAMSSALLSRCTIYALEPLKTEEIVDLLERALALEFPHVEAQKEALSFLALSSNGDARHCLNALELACQVCEPSEGKKILTKEAASEAIGKPILCHDRNGDSHYDSMSAFIKSMRGSDPNAALYWLARLLESGEEPRYIARRLVIHAAEDIGLADPLALQTATAAQSAVETIGMPEARIPLAMAALHIALAPKSNSACNGMKLASSYIQNHYKGAIPPHLKDTHYEGAATLGSGEGYKYPHDYRGGFVSQEYLPKENKDAKLYEPCLHGYERELNTRLKELREFVQKA